MDGNQGTVKKMDQADVVKEESLTEQTDGTETGEVAGPEGNHSQLCD